MGILNVLEDRYNGVEEAYIYVMEFVFRTKTGYKTLYKVGITRNKPIDRMLEIVRSFFMGRRYVPECRLVRHRKLPHFLKKEKEVHTELIEFNYKFNSSFSGSTEFFDIDIDKLLFVYESVCPKIEKDLRLRK